MKKINKQKMKQFRSQRADNKSKKKIGLIVKSRQSNGARSSGVYAYVRMALVIYNCIMKSKALKISIYRILFYFWFANYFLRFFHDCNSEH